MTISEFLNDDTGINVDELLSRVYFANNREEAIFVVTDYDGTEESRKRIGEITHTMIDEGLIPVFAYTFLNHCDLYEQDKDEYFYYRQKAMQMMSIIIYRMQCEEIRVYGALSKESEMIFEVLASEFKRLNVYDEQMNRIAFENVELADVIPEKYWKLHDIYHKRQWDVEYERALFSKEGEGE